MSTGNKRVTQLVELTSNQMEFEDLFLIIDVTARESKKIKASELSLWLNNSGSLFAVNSINADTASFILGTNVYGIVASASYAISASNAAIASIASSSISSSNALSSSYATTASFALNGGSGGAVLTTGSTYEITSSWSINSINAINSQNASFLLYFGGNNGTASFAMVSGLADTATLAATASYFNNLTGMVASSSYAVNAETASVIASDSVGTASHLLYSPTNGTAAFAIQAGSIAGVMNNYGMYQAIAQSSSGSVIHNLTVSSSLGAAEGTMIQVIGTAYANFTASFPYPSYNISLQLTDRKSGVSGSVDSTNMDFYMANVINSWGNPTSGTIYMPFNLISQQDLMGEFLLEVTSSDRNLVIDPDRNAKFIISSYSDYVTVNSDDSLQFFVAPSSSVTLSFSSSTVAGAHKDFLPGFLDTGSQYITWLDISDQNVIGVLYTWQLCNLTHFICSDNPLLQNLDYSFAPSLQVLTCDGCALETVANLSNTTASVLNFENNSIVMLPELSPSTSYLQVSNNPLAALPSFFPPSLQYLFVHDTNIGGAVPVLPDGLIAAQFYNTVIQSLPNPLPLSMSYLDISNTLVTTMSAAPISLSYIDVSYAQFDTNGLINLTYELVANTQVSGTFRMLGYGPPTDLTLLANLTTLTASNWTNYYDP